MRPVQISILHTNDMHGRLEAISRLSNFARRLRAEAEAEGRLTFFWDAGDAEDRRIGTHLKSSWLTLRIALGRCHCERVS